MENISFREATSQDIDALWAIFEPIVAAGEIYPYDPQSSKADMVDIWLSPEKRTYVALEGETVVGTYYLRDNQPCLAAHIVNAGYMMHPDHQGKGIGKKMCEHSQVEAKKLGYKGMQFNLVVSTNQGAIALWQKCGFDIVATIPKGFQHQKLGLVDTHIMYKEL